MNTNEPTLSTIHTRNRKALKGSIYKTNRSVIVNHENPVLCPTTGRRFVARISVTTDGFMVRMPHGGSVQQYTWEAKGGRAELMRAIRYLAKHTLEKSFAGRYGVNGFVRTDLTCELPSKAWAAWGYDMDNAKLPIEGTVSIEVPYFDVLVDFTS